ncbi:flagellar protein FliT [Undibacterium oligocarboniphilum]|nr:flagellar protein FliT [Undibacterium oligocarboniphilum]
MMENLEIIHLYENVAVITDQMLQAARERDWELLTQLETSCTTTVQKIRDSEQPVPLTAELKERKISVIKKILADDREIRDITEPWMAELAELMKNSSVTQKLNRTYGASPA